MQKEPRTQPFKPIFEMTLLFLGLAVFALSIYASLNESPISIYSQEIFYSSFVFFAVSFVSIQFRTSEKRLKKMSLKHDQYLEQQRVADQEKKREANIMKQQEAEAKRLEQEAIENHPWTVKPEELELQDVIVIFQEMAKHKEFKEPVNQILSQIKRCDKVAQTILDNSQYYIEDVHDWTRQIASMYVGACMAYRIYRADELDSSEKDGILQRLAKAENSLGGTIDAMKKWQKLIVDNIDIKPTVKSDDIKNRIEASVTALEQLIALKGGGK